MSHFAKVRNNIVEEIIVAEQEFIDSLPVENAVNWIQTSYNTFAGQHLLGGTPLRKNYAGIGYTYDSERDAFIPPQPYSQWILDQDTCEWQAPIPYPADGKQYAWNEINGAWQQWDCFQ